MEIKYKIWIEKDGKVVFGRGRDDILKAIDEQRIVFDYWWKATLNIASSDSFTLSFPSGRVIVFISHQ